MTDLKEPNQAYRMGAYNLKKAQEAFDEYANMAVECFNQAVRIEQEAGENVAYFEIANEMAIVRETQGHVNRQIEGKVHRRLAKKARAKGYRNITLADLEEFGATGNR